MSRVNASGFRELLIAVAAWSFHTVCLISAQGDLQPHFQVDQKLLAFLASRSSCKGEAAASAAQNQFLGNLLFSKLNEIDPAAMHR
jgi:hypothetical protein